MHEILSVLVFFPCSIGESLWHWWDPPALQQAECWACCCLLWSNAKAQFRSARCKRVAVTCHYQGMGCAAFMLNVSAETNALWGGTKGAPAWREERWLRALGFGLWLLVILKVAKIYIDNQSLEWSMPTYQNWVQQRLETCSAPWWGRVWYHLSLIFLGLF